MKRDTLLAQPPSWSLYTGSHTWPQMPWHYALVSKLQRLRHRNVVATLGLLTVPGQGLGPASSCLVHEAVSCSLRKKIPALKAVKLKRKLILLHDVAQAIDFLKSMLPYGTKRAFLRRGIRLDHVWCVAGVSGPTVTCNNQNLRLVVRTCITFRALPFLR